MRGPYVAIAVLVLICATHATEVLALPDAAVTGLAAEGMDLEGGDRVPLSVTITNQGDSALAPVPVVLQIDDSPLAEWRLPQALAPGARAEWVFAWTATRGPHVILARADPLNDVAESEETNNTAFLSLGVAEEAEPSPWPALLVGFASLLVGLAAGLLLQRKRHQAPPPSRFQRPPGPVDGRG